MPPGAEPSERGRSPHPGPVLYDTRPGGIPRRRPGFPGCLSIRLRKGYGHDDSSPNNDASTGSNGLARTEVRAGRYAEQGPL